MVKDTTQEQVSKLETPKARSVKPKKKLVKKVGSDVPKKVKKVKNAESTDAASESTKKPSIRKFNDKPVLSSTTGINISPAKVKNIVSNYVLNKKAYSTLKELRNATPRVITKTVDGKEVVENFAGIPLTQLSKESIEYIEYATQQYDNAQRDEFAKGVVDKMTGVDRTKYLTARNAAKNVFDTDEKNKFLIKCEAFDMHSFNTSYDPNFYKGFTVNCETDSEWKTAINKVTKLNNRFSTNSRVYLSTLVEYLIKQLATNGTVCCVADKKKIIQLSHILDTSKPGFEERFPLFPLIVNLSTYKQAMASISEQSSVKEVVSDDTDDTSVAETKSDKHTDMFKLDELPHDKQHQFRYYIGETCREVRMRLAQTEKDENGDCMSVYNYTSVSKVFKNFCSTLICEFLMRIGQMLEQEIITRGIKTVNDTVIKTVISHYHIVSGVSDVDTFKFMRETTNKYYDYVSKRQEKRKAKKGEKSDLVYSEK